jgi:hypothetical protein
LVAVNQWPIQTFPDPKGSLPLFYEAVRTFVGHLIAVIVVNLWQNADFLRNLQKAIGAWSTEHKMQAIQFWSSLVRIQTQSLLLLIWASLKKTLSTNR